MSCDTQYEKLSTELLALAKNQKVLYDQLKKLVVDYTAMNQNLMELKQARSTDFEERKAQDELLQKTLGKLNADIGDMRNFLLGNGRIETGLMYMVRKLVNDFDNHIADSNRVETRIWNVVEKVIVYFVIAAITALVTLLATGKI